MGCPERGGVFLHRLIVVEDRWSTSLHLAPSLAQLHAAAFISGRPVYVQRNGLANTRLKYAMKFNSFVRKSSTDVNEPRRITFRMITPKIKGTAQIAVEISFKTQRRVAEPRSRCLFYRVWPQERASTKTTVILARR